MKSLPFSPPGPPDPPPPAPNRPSPSLWLSRLSAPYRVPAVFSPLSHHPLPTRTISASLRRTGRAGDLREDSRAGIWGCWSEGSADQCLRLVSPPSGTLLALREDPELSQRLPLIFRVSCPGTPLALQVFHAIRFPSPLSLHPCSCPSLPLSHPSPLSIKYLRVLEWKK